MALKAKGNSVELEIPKPRYLVAVVRGSQREVYEMEGDFGAVLKEAQRKHKGCQLQITPIK